MDLDAAGPFLLACLGLAYALLLVWFAVFVFAHDWLRRLHGRWFRLDPAAFDAIHYAGMALFKVGALLLFAIPWLALVLLR